MISKHISYKEATQSQTATRKGIKNDPTLEQLNSMKLIAEKVFEPLREWYGKPITISSFFRSEKLNKAIGGSTTSQHGKGEAMDIDTEKDNAILFLRIKENGLFDQLIWEFGDDKNPDWVHVSYKKEGNRSEVLRAKKVKGKTVYEKF